MGRFKELNANTEKALLALLDNQEIVDLLASNEEDRLSPFNLLYKNLYPYKYIPGVQSDAMSYITMTIRDIRKPNNSNAFKFAKLTFYVIVHNSLIGTGDGLRHWRLLNAIDEVFNGNSNFGIGKLEFDGADELSLNENYVCYWISYKSCNFN